MSIDWTQEVKEYKEQYDDDDGIHEYVESYSNEFWAEYKLSNDEEE